MASRYAMWCAHRDGWWGESEGGLERAVEHLSLAAEQNQNMAQLDLGLCYLYGHGPGP